MAGSGAYRLLKKRCQESIVCISALNCVKMRLFAIPNIINARYLNSERYLPKERGKLTDMCINSSDMNLWRDHETIVCLKRGARNLLSA